MVIYQILFLWQPVYGVHICVCNMHNKEYTCVEALTNLLYYTYNQFLASICILLSCVYINSPNNLGFINSSLLYDKNSRSVYIKH